MKVENRYSKPVFVISKNNLLVLYAPASREAIKSIYIPKTVDTVIVGKPVFEYNQNYTTQYSTTQGLPALNIFNHYDVPILVNDLVIDPHCKIRYVGVYHNGIPYGDILHSSFDEDVVVVDRATDLHFGLATCI